jgi:hypothetical protein
VIISFSKGLYVHFAYFEIGFVLHKNRLICRGFSTDVERQTTEDRRQTTEDRIQTIDYKFLLHKELSCSLKSEILKPKSETNPNYTKLNVQNGSLPNACRDSGWMALSPCCAAAYDMQTEMSSPPAGGLSFACWLTGGHFNIFSNKSQVKSTTDYHGFFEVWMGGCVNAWMSGCEKRIVFLLKILWK